MLPSVVVCRVILWSIIKSHGGVAAGASVLLVLLCTGGSGSDMYIHTYIYTHPIFVCTHRANTQSLIQSLYTAGKHKCK